MKGKKKKKRAVILLTVALSILFIALAAGLFIPFVTPEKSSKPVYEEDYISSNKFKSIIREVDFSFWENMGMAIQIHIKIHIEELNILFENRNIRIKPIIMVE